MTPQHTNPPDRMDFNLKVWDLVRQIPPGKVATYGQIAGLIPAPGEMEARSYRAFGARWVGGAMAACPDDVPWQRVINSKGEISLRRGGGSERQRELLEAEGVKFDERGRIDLKRYRWAGPGAPDVPDWVQPSFDDLL
jgi:methylated-DNA-protein-cysteine methyltransferase-like protein